jgi:hypothetical protein
LISGLGVAETRNLTADQVSSGAHGWLCGYAPRAHLQRNIFSA